MPQTPATATAAAVTLPVDLSNIDDIIESYLDERADPAWFDPYTAGSRCHIASEDFVAWARTQGYNAEMVERHDTPGFCGEHTAARIGPFVFDPTSAQLPHTLGVSGETVDYDPAVHRPTGGWYGIIPDGSPKRLGAPRWPADGAWDDLSEPDQAAMTCMNIWVEW